MGRTATFSSQEQQRLRQVAFKAGVSSEGRASEATWKKVKQLFNEVPPCQARSCEALRKHFQRNIALKRRREAANEDDGNNGDDSDDDDKEAQAEHIVRSLRSDLREAASERCSPPWMQMTWTQRLAAVQEYARERGQLVRFDGAFVYASPQASPSPLDLHEENVKRRRIGDESAPEEQAKDAGVAEPGLEEGGADGPPGADQAQKKAGRKKISYDEYNRIGNMLVGYLAREAEEGRIVMEKDLVAWYFEQVDDEIQTEAQLMEQVGLVHFIINRMISKDRIIIVQQASADPQRPGMRTLVKHPNYLVPTHRPDRSPTEMPVPTQMPSPTSAAEDEDGMQAVAGTQLEGLPPDAFMPQPLFAPPGMVVLGCMGMPDPPPPGGGFLSEVVAWSLAALLLIAYVTYVGGRS